jgi:hypothetical protein
MAYKGLKWYDKIAYLFRWDNTKHWLATACLAAVVLLTVEVTLTLIATRHSFEKGQYAEQVRLAAEEITRASGHIDQAIVHADERVQALGPTQEAATDLIRHQDANLTATSQAIIRQVNGLQEPREAITRVLDQSRSDLASLQDFITHKDSETTALINSGTLLIKTYDTKSQAILDGFDIVIKGPDGLQGVVAKSNQSLTEINGILGNTNKATALALKKFDNLINPPPCHGTTCWLKKYILRPIQLVGGPAYLVERLAFNIP